MYAYICTGTLVLATLAQVVAGVDQPSTRAQACPGRGISPSFEGMSFDEGK